MPRNPHGMSHRNGHIFALRGASEHTHSGLAVHMASVWATFLSRISICLVLVSVIDVVGSKTCCLQKNTTAFIGRNTVQGHPRSLLSYQSKVHMNCTNLCHILYCLQDIVHYWSTNHAIPMTQPPILIVIMFCTHFTRKPVLTLIILFSTHITKPSYLKQLTLITLHYIRVI